jgi:LPXTG-motif cell wall-anchored protein
MIAGTMPAAPLRQDSTIPVVRKMSEPVPVETGQEAPARRPAMLPKTGSPVPLIGFLGLLAVAVALTIRVLRTR